MQPLEIKDAIVIALSDKPKQYLATINGRQHLILETSYAVFPQTSGKLVIPSVIYSVVPNVERDIWSDPFGRNRNNILRIPSEEKHITVNPSPPQAAGKIWQPATNLTLNETWSSSLDNLKMGEPVTRTLTITADGLTGGQIAPLPTTAVEGLTFYPDQPQNSDAKTTNGISGTRVETTAIIPNRGGDFTLPEIKVDWWDSKTQSLQSAVLPAKTLRVLGSAVMPLPNPSTDTPADISNGPTATPTAASTSHGWLLASTILFGFLSLSLLAYVIILKRKLKTLFNDQDQARKIISEQERHIWDLLKQASANKDAPELRKSVLRWAKFQWPQSSIHSLDDVAKLGNRPELTRSLKKLDELLYSDHPDETWAPETLLQLLKECREEKRSKKKTDQLKPLYQDS